MRTFDTRHWQISLVLSIDSDLHYIVAFHKLSEKDGNMCMIVDCAKVMHEGNLCIIRDNGSFNTKLGETLDLEELVEAGFFDVITFEELKLKLSKM